MLLSGDLCCSSEAVEASSIAQEQLLGLERAKQETERSRHNAELDEKLANEANVRDIIEQRRLQGFSLRRALRMQREGLQVCIGLVEKIIENIFC